MERNIIKKRIEELKKKLAYFKNANISEILNLLSLAEEYMNNNDYISAISYVDRAEAKIKLHYETPAMAAAKKRAAKMGDPGSYRPPRISNAVKLKLTEMRLLANFIMKKRSIWKVCRDVYELILKKDEYDIIYKDVEFQLPQDISEDIERKNTALKSRYENQLSKLAQNYANSGKSIWDQFLSGFKIPLTKYKSLVEKVITEGHNTAAILKISQDINESLNYISQGNFGHDTEERRNNLAKVIRLHSFLRGKGGGYSVPKNYRGKKVKTRFDAAQFENWLKSNADADYNDEKITAGLLYTDPEGITDSFIDLFFPFYLDLLNISDLLKNHQNDIIIEDIDSYFIDAPKIMQKNKTKMSIEMYRKWLEKFYEVFRDYHLDSADPVQDQDQDLLPVEGDISEEYKYSCEIKFLDQQTMDFFANKLGPDMADNNYAQYCNAYSDWIQNRNINVDENFLNSVGNVYAYDEVKRMERAYSLHFNADPVKGKFEGERQIINYISQDNTVDYMHAFEGMILAGKIDLFPSDPIVKSRVLNLSRSLPHDENTKIFFIFVADKIETSKPFVEMGDFAYLTKVLPGEGTVLNKIASIVQPDHAGIGGMVDDHFFMFLNVLCLILIIILLLKILPQKYSFPIKKLNII